MDDAPAPEPVPLYEADLAQLQQLAENGVVILLVLAVIGAFVAGIVLVRAVW